MQHYLGLFTYEEDAAKAYDKHAMSVLGNKAKTNFDYNDTPAAFVPSIGVPNFYDKSDEVMILINLN